MWMGCESCRPGMVCRVPLIACIRREQPPYTGVVSKAQQTAADRDSEHAVGRSPYSPSTYVFRSKACKKVHAHASGVSVKVPP